MNSLSSLKNLDVNLDYETDFIFWPRQLFANKTQPAQTCATQLGKFLVFDLLHVGKIPNIWLINMILISATSKSEVSKALLY